MLQCKSWEILPYKFRLTSANILDEAIESVCAVHIVVPSILCDQFPCVLRKQIDTMRVRNYCIILSMTYYRTLHILDSSQTWEHVLSDMGTCPGWQMAGWWYQNKND